MPKRAKPKKSNLLPVPSASGGMGMAPADYGDEMPVPPQPVYHGAVEPLKPGPSLLCKLGSIVVHAEEFLSPRGHEFDKAALDQLLQDGEVKAWVAAMDKMAMIPRKR